MGNIPILIAEFVGKLFANLFSGPWRRFRRRIGFTRARALTAGVILLAVPTVFTVVPGWTTWNGWWRAAVMGVWLLVAVVTAAGAITREEAIGALTEEHVKQRRRRRLAATHGVLRALLTPGTRGIPEGYEFTIYLWDETQNVLLPWYPAVDLRGQPDHRVFSPGNGATGSCWEAHQTFVVCGTAVSNAKHGLTVEQQRLFRRYRSVAATPLWGQDGEPFGVLTAISKTNDDYFSDEGGTGQTNLESLAETVAVVLEQIPHPEDFA